VFADTIAVTAPIDGVFSRSRYVGTVLGADATVGVINNDGYDLRFDAEGQLVRASNCDKGITIVQYYDDDGARRLSLVLPAG